MENIFDKLNNSLKKYFLQFNFKNQDFYCRKCGKLLFDLNEINKYTFSNIGINGNIINSYIFWKQENKNSKKIPIIHEPEEFRWILFGKKLHSCNKILFRHICWDCFYDNLKDFIDIKSQARKNKWYKRIMNGEKLIPLYNIASSNYFKLLFDITDEELKMQKKQLATASIEKFIKKYGEETGKEKWKEYCNKQGLKNTKKYKMNIKGWSEEEWNNFNKLRASTLSNFINRYGEETGKEKWKEYCNKEAYKGNKLDYFIEKYGIVEGKKKYLEINAKKSLSIENFINKYGEIEGRKKFNRIKNKGYSIISQELFQKIDNILGKMSIDSKYASKGLGEATINLFFNDGKCKICHPDYMLNTKIIEFNGDFWHANPNVYKDENEIINTFSGKYKVKDIWENDNQRYLALQNLGYKVLVIWESEYKNNEQLIIQKCIDFLKT